MRDGEGGSERATSRRYVPSTAVIEFLLPRTDRGALRLRSGEVDRCIR